MGKKILLSTLRLKRKMEANDMGTIIVLIVLAIIVALIIRSMVKDKKSRQVTSVRWRLQQVWRTLPLRLKR